jgi:hypothetical protein
VGFSCGGRDSHESHPHLAPGRDLYVSLCRTLESWAEAMACEGTPGDDLALDALATMIGINILLYLPASRGRPIHFPAISERRFGDGYIQIAHVPLAGTVRCRSMPFQAPS